MRISFLLFYARQIARALFWTIPVSAVLGRTQARQFWAELARWVYLQANTKVIPIVDLETLYPGITQREVRVGYPGVAGRLFEQVAIAQLIREREPKTIFEIGTAYGGTTLLMAKNSGDDVEIYTLDLPPDWRAEHLRQEVGKAFRGDECEDKITQLLGDSREFDFSPWKGKSDLVYVDACHDYEFVKSDTENALSLLSDKGVIIWHDYPSDPGVCRVINQLASKMQIYLIKGTRIALYDSGRA